MEFNELTDEQKEYLKSIEFEFLFQNGFVQDSNDWSDIAVVAIFKYKMHQGISDRYLCSRDEDGSISIFGGFSTERRFENAKLKEKYLFYNSIDDEKVYSKLSAIDKESDYPFITEKGNSYKYIESI